MPRWRGKGILWAYILVLITLPARAPAQQPTPSGPAPSAGRIPRLIPRTSVEREQRFVAQHRIILNVRVADAAGRPKPELNEGDFTLYDNDHPRKLVSFRSVDGNSGDAHVVLVIDTVNNFTRQIRYFEKEIEKYLRENSDPLPVPIAIGIFSGYGISVGHSSRDRGALLADLASKTADLRATGCITQQDHPDRMNAPFTPGGLGGTRSQSAQELQCKNDRFVASVNAVARLARGETEVPGRLLLIWLGPGWPMLTDRAFSPDPPDLKQNFYGQLVSLSMSLREAQVTVDAVGSPDESIDPQTPNLHDSDFFAGVTDADQASAAHFGLHVFAHQTGGRIIPETKDVTGQIAACIADVESYYVLTFDAPPAANFGEYHALAVKVDKPGLDVRTNTLYYAEQ